MKHKLVLASNSPRRQQIMREAGLDFTTRIIPLEEDFPDDLPASEVAEYLALKKGKAYQQQMHPEELIVTADTTVVVGDKVLNKPVDKEEAISMLQLLSGRRHQVITGVCISRPEEQHSFSDTTTVWFRRLDLQEIEYYVNQYRPFDKAGAYAIQEWIGMVGIERIEGSYFNVVGLPIEKLYEKLKKLMVLSVNRY